MLLQKDCCKFKVSLVYIVCSRKARVTEQDPVSKQPTLQPEFKCLDIEALFVVKVTFYSDPSSKPGFYPFIQNYTTKKVFKQEVKPLTTPLHSDSEPRGKDEEKE